MRKTALVCLVLVAVVSFGCAGRINTMMQSWEGHSFPELISRWGPPQQVFSDGQGGQVLVYTQVRSYTVPGSSTTTTNLNGQVNGNNINGTATSQTVYSPAMTYQWQIYRMFFIDATSVVSQM
jgi:hypothetical protein